MAKLHVPSTKSSALSVGRQLQFATEGYDLLEQKRQILVQELMRWLARARTIEQEVNDAVEAAYRALRQAALALGAAKLTREAVAIQPSHRVELHDHTLMGVHITTLTAEAAATGPEFSFADSSPRSDEVKRTFEEALDAITRMAEVENAVFRVAQELRRTQRRVNALEKIFIPTYTETLRYIEDALEEHEREELVVMKMAKAKLERARHRPADSQDEPRG